MKEYRFKGYHNSNSICGLEIFKTDDNYIVVLHELDENSGTSATNMIEYLCAEIYLKYLKDKTELENVIFFIKRPLEITPFAKIIFRNNKIKNQYFHGEIRPVLNSPGWETFSQKKLNEILKNAEKII